MARRYSFVIECLEKGSKEVARIDHVEGPSFECPHCKLRLVFLNDNEGRRLGAQGRTKETIKHNLRKVTEHAG